MIRAASGLATLPGSLLIARVGALPTLMAGLLIAGVASGLRGALLDVWTVAFAGLMGFVIAGVLTLGFALPPLLSAPADLARMSAAMFTISYSEGLLVSVASGASCDLGGRPVFAFLPIALSALPLLVLPPTIDFTGRRAGTDAATSKGA